MVDKSQLIQTMLCVNSNLRKASRVTTRLYTEIVSEAGLQKTQFTVLAAIGILEKATVTSLAATLTMDQTTVTRSIEILEKHRWVDVSPMMEDKRVKAITLTATGESVLDEAFPLWQKAQQIILNELGEEDTEKLLTLLNKVSSISEAD